MLKDLEIGVGYVELSLDGASKKVHENFRMVPGCFEKTVEGIRNCVDEDLSACIATTAHKENLDEISKIMKLADQIVVRFMHFNYIPTGRAKEHLKLDLTPRERLGLLQMLGNKIVDLYIKSKEEEKQTGKASISVDRIFSTCPQFACPQFASVVKKIAREKGHECTVSAHYAAIKGVEVVANFLGGCGAGRLYIALEPNGDIKPCVFFPTNEDTILGNILKDDIENVWDNNPYFVETKMLRTSAALTTRNYGRKLYMVFKEASIETQ
jgi:MoaA/NifB/PqqE/SkfB family radical SAM enzyme